MALTYVFGTNGVQEAVALSGKVYVPGVGGLITGVAPADAWNLNISSGTITLICATGATTDRPQTINSPALTGSFNNVHPQLTFGTPFYDATLSQTVWWVGYANSSTGWVNQAGAAV